MAIKSLQVLEFGMDAEVPKEVLTFLVDRGKMAQTVFLGFLIRTDDSNILVDTGTHLDDIQMQNSMGCKLISRPEDQLPQRLNEVGLSLGDIDLVIITHLHWDHVGWLDQLRNAEIIVQKDELDFALSPLPYAWPYFPKRYDSPEIRWKPVNGDHIIMPGLTLLFTPGHSVGHQAVMVDLPKSGTILLCGDAGFLQENFVKELIPVFFSDPKQALFSIKKLNVWSKIKGAPIFPSHDIAYWREHMLKSPEAYT